MIGRSDAVPTRCRFTILGPPGLTCGGAQLDLGAPQQQAVLSLLLINSGCFVRISELIDGLWGDRPPATGGAVIRTYISRLRRLLSEHGLTSSIRSRSGGYMLDSSLFVVDSVEFAELIDTARQDRASGRIAIAVKGLQEALGLWRGAALAGVPGEAAERERSRLERLRLTATQELLELRLGIGQHAEVVAEVPLLIGLNPLEEALYEIYMLALYRCGRRAEALELYRVVYDLLGEELGIGPGPRLRAIHEMILRSDAEIDPRIGALIGRPDASGQRTEPPEETPARAGATEPISARLDRRRDERFVGRETERAIFRTLLDRSGGDRSTVLFLVGPAGIGKSTLLRRLADDAAGARRQAWCVDGRDPGAARRHLEELAAENSGVVTPVVLVDSFEALGGLEPWLRTEFLPRLPDDTVAVIAGGKGPSITWLTDPAWSGAILHRQLDALSAAESAALVEARGVGRDMRQPIVNFAAGNPFALSLAAEVGRSMSATGQPMRREAVRYVVDNVVARLVGPVPSAKHRWALHVCAHARNTTEDLLRSVVSAEDAMELFEWLGEQSYVETAQPGLDVNGVLRKALDHQLRWRDPVGYERMRRRIRDYVTDGHESDDRRSCRRDHDAMRSCRCNHHKGLDRILAGATR